MMDLDQSIKLQEMSRSKVSIKAGADVASASAFIATIMDAVTRIHKAHFMTTGPGSFAGHVALGEAYEALTEDFDNLAETFSGTAKEGLVFPGVTVTPFSAEVQSIYDYVKANRASAGTDEHMQNLVDEILDHLARSLFKLNRLS